MSRTLPTVCFACVCVCVCVWTKGNVLFKDALNTFYLRLPVYVTVLHNLYSLYWDQEATCIIDAIHSNTFILFS